MTRIRMIRTGRVRGVTVERGALVDDLTRTEAHDLVNIGKAVILDDEGPAAPPAGNARKVRGDGGRKRK